MVASSAHEWAAFVTHGKKRNCTSSRLSVWYVNKVRHRLQNRNQTLLDPAASRLKKEARGKPKSFNKTPRIPVSCRSAGALLLTALFRRTHCRGRIIGQQRYKCMNLSCCCVDIGGKNQSATSAKRHLCTCDANLPQSHSADLCLPPAQSSAACELGRSHSAKAAWSCFPTALIQSEHFPIVRRVV